MDDKNNIDELKMKELKKDIELLMVKYSFKSAYNKAVYDSVCKMLNQTINIIDL